MGTLIKVITILIFTLVLMVPATGADPRDDFIDASKCFLYGDYDKALDKIALILDEEPDNIAALELRGRIEITKGDLDSALVTFEEAIVVDGDDYRGWQGKGEVLERMYKLDEAVDAYTVAVENNKKASSSLYALAILYARKGDRNNSFQHLEKAVKNDPYLKDNARVEPDFQGYRGDGEFWNILR
jgi:tetratricopeptide (TPR) repeat protein